MNPLNASGTSRTYVAQIHPFPAPSFIGGMAVVTSLNQPSVNSSGGPIRIYEVENISQPSILTMDILFYDVNPATLEANFTVNENILNSYSGLYWSTYSNTNPIEVFPSIEKQTAAFNWQNSESSYSLYTTQGNSEFYPYDSYNYTIDLTFSSDFNFSQINIDSLSLTPNSSSSTLGKAYQPTNPPSLSTQETDLSYWKITVFASYVKPHNASIPSQLQVVFSIVRSSNSNANIALGTDLAMFVLLGASVVMVGKKQIQNRLFVYLTIFVFEFTFFSALSVLAPEPLVFGGMTLIQNVTYTLVPCTTILAVKSMGETWLPKNNARSSLYQTIADGIAVFFASLVLYFLTAISTTVAYVYNPATNSYSPVQQEFNLLDVKDFHAYGVYLLLALYGGLVFTIAVKLIRREWNRRKLNLLFQGKLERNILLPVLNSYQSSLIFGFFGTFAIINPLFPLWLRIAFIPGLVGAVGFNIANISLRFLNIEHYYPRFSRFEPIVSGITDGITISIIILTILTFYFNVHVAVPSL
jgi:hypothetical protein